jgi:UDP-N-acetylmuramoylalanine--D-glutamate ligase
VPLIFGRQDVDLLADIDFIVFSPGVPIDIPLILAAKSKGITVMSEIEVAYHLCPAPIIAITGTNGKTTTTTLLGEMLKTTDKDVVVGGNIGAALSQEVSSVDKNGIVVAEISSFQLEGVIDFHPRISAILNVTPDHLDRHHSMAAYIQMKERIFANQTADDYLILNYDDTILRDMAQRTSAQVFFFSRKIEVENGAFVKNGVITLTWQGKTMPVCSVEKMQIKGAHNIENALAACGAAFLSGVTLTGIEQVLQEFPGVEHRIEPVETVNGVEYYNDSKATNPESAMKALESFSGHIILIAGGKDKHTDLSDFMRLAREKTDHLILLGEAGERFRLAAEKEGVQSIHQVTTFADAVKLAHRLANPPQVVVLSPACSSYDMFTSYEERGRVFKKLVRELG